MKKKLLLVVTVFLLGIVLTGCGNKKPKYSINKEVEIKEELSKTDENKFLEEAANVFDETKRVTAQYTYTIDSGEYMALDGLKKRYNINVRFDIIINESEDKKEFAVGYTGEGKLTSEDDSTERYTFDGTNFVKDGVNYINTFCQTITKKDGKERANVVKEHYKENYDGLKIVFGMMPTSVKEVKLQFLELVTAMKLANAKIGSVNKHTTIMQNMAEEKTLNRIVFDDKNLTYIGSNITYKDTIKVTLEKQFNLGSAKINFPNPDSYEEKK